MLRSAATSCCSGTFWGQHSRVMEDGATKGAIHRDLIRLECAALDRADGAGRDHDGAGKVPLAALERRAGDRQPVI